MKVGATSTSQVSSFLDQVYGSSAPITVYAGEFTEPSSRYSKSGRIHAGQQLQYQDAKLHQCTAGFGAVERYKRPGDGRSVHRPFLLTAGHCFPAGATVKRGFDGDPDPQKVGVVARRSLDHVQAGHETDGEAIRLPSRGLSPGRIYLTPSKLPRITGQAKAYDGMLVCHSGVFSDRRRCGVVRGATEFYTRSAAEIVRGPFWQVIYDPRPNDSNFLTANGDSGGPVWQPKTGRAIGLHSTGPAPPTMTTLLPPHLPRKSTFPGQPAPTQTQAPGILEAPGMIDPSPRTGPLYLDKGG